MQGKTCLTVLLNVFQAYLTTETIFHGTSVETHLKKNCSMSTSSEVSENPLLRVKSQIFTSKNSYAYPYIYLVPQTLSPIRYAGTRPFFEPYMKKMQRLCDVNDDAL